MISIDCDIFAAYNKAKETQKPVEIKNEKGNTAFTVKIEKDTGSVVDDEKIIDIIAKEMKKKKDAIADFEKAARQDLIDQTNEEMKVLEEYLPKQLSREEIKEVVSKIISDIGATSMKDMGIVMKESKSAIGAGADGKTINEVVKELLN